jgi:hypothetical protein
MDWTLLVVWAANWHPNPIMQPAKQAKPLYFISTLLTGGSVADFIPRVNPAEGTAVIPKRGIMYQWNVAGGRMAGNQRFPSGHSSDT